MLHPEIPLRPRDIYDAPGPDDQDGIIRQCQIHFIAEAIRETHREAVEALFMDQQPQQTGPMKPRTQLVMMVIVLHCLNLTIYPRLSAHCLVL
jgi:hypothetical protein